MDRTEVEQAMARMGPMPLGMRWRFEIEVPRIVDTNLQREGDKRAHYGVDYDEDVGARNGQAAVEAFRRMMGAKWITFDGVE